VQVWDKIKNKQYWKSVLVLWLGYIVLGTIMKHYLFKHEFTDAVIKSLSSGFFFSIIMNLLMTKGKNKEN